MRNWRNLAALAIVLAAAVPGWAQTCTLGETANAGDCFKIVLEMKLSGERRIHQEGKVVPQKMSASAAHELVERVLAASAGLPQKTARHYGAARVQIAVDGKSIEDALRSDRRLIVAQRDKDRLLTYSPAGPLTREEVELTAEHFDTLAVAGLLPGKAVKVGESWKVGTSVAQHLCAFDGLIAHDLAGKLEGIAGDEARLSFAGTAKGIEKGALVQITVTATAVFHLKQGRLVALDWKQKDEREQGPVSPAATLETAWSMKRQPLDELPKEVSDVALVQVPEGTEPPPAPFLQISQRDAKDRFVLNHSRDWQVVGRTDDHLILRLMDRGDFVAQATVAVLAKAEPKKHLSPDEFKQLLDDQPGWEAEQVRDDGEVKAEKGNYLYRVSALGELDEAKVLQIFYLAAGPEGDQVVVNFTLRPAQADKLATRDLDLVNGVEFPKK